MFIDIAKKNKKLDLEDNYECPLTLPHLIHFERSIIVRETTY